MASQENYLSPQKYFAAIRNFCRVNSLPDLHVVFNFDGVSWIIAVILKAPARINFLLDYHGGIHLDAVFSIIPGILKVPAG